MLGDDANVVFMELIKRLLEIVKTISDGHYRNSGMKKKEPKKPKIKVGKLSKAEFSKLRNSGTDFKCVTLPTEKLAEFEKSMKNLGGSFFAAKIENGNNAIVSVPTQYLNFAETAIKHIVADVMAENPEALKIKDGTDKVDEADMELTADVLRNYDIPVYSFKSADGKYMNVVPDEFNGQYEAAMKEVREVSEQLKNIEITGYEQTSPLDSLDVFAVKLSPEAAKALYAAAKFSGTDIKFAKHNGADIAVFSKDVAAEVQKFQENFKNELGESEEYLIDIKDSTITMDVEKLVKDENESTYFVRVPNTGGRDYLILDKSDVEVINGGKTLSMKLDMSKQYNIFDANRNLKTEKTGAELSKSYNTKSLRADKDTKIARYGSGIERIELYNQKQNKLISIAIDRADKIRTNLIAQGLSVKAAEMLLKDINSKLPDKYKERFNYTEEKAEIVYADVPNIGNLIAQCQLSQQVVGKAECFGELPTDKGSKVCLFDSAANKYTVLPSLPREEIESVLTEMGYTGMTAKILCEKLDISASKAETRENIAFDPKHFDSNNPELSNMMFHNSEYGMLIVQESGDQFKYMDIDKGTPMADVEKAILKSFDVKDEKSAVEIMKQLAKDGIVETAEPKKIADVSIQQLSTNYVEITKGNSSAIMPKNKLDKEKLSEMGVSNKTISAIQKSIRSAERVKDKSGGQTLKQLEKAASKEVAKNTALNDKPIEKAKVGQSR